MDNSRNAIIITNSRPTFFEWMVMGPKGNYRLIVASLSFRFVVGLIAVSCVEISFVNIVFPLVLKVLTFSLRFKIKNHWMEDTMQLLMWLTLSACDDPEREQTKKNIEQSRNQRPHHNSDLYDRNHWQSYIFEREIIIYLSSSLSSCSSNTH